MCAKNYRDEFPSLLPSPFWMACPSSTAGRAESSKCRLFYMSDCLMTWLCRVCVCVRERKGERDRQSETERGRMCVCVCVLVKEVRYIPYKKIETNSLGSLHSDTVEWWFLLRGFLHTLKTSLCANVWVCLCVCLWACVCCNPSKCNWPCNWPGFVS